MFANHPTNNSANNFTNNFTNNRLSHIIALRHIRTKNANRFLSFSSGISLVGLTLGVAVLVIVTSVMNGFEHALTNRLLGVVPQIQIQSATPDPNWHRLATDIAKEDANIIGFDGEMTLRGMIAIDGKPWHRPKPARPSVHLATQHARWQPKFSTAGCLSYCFG